MATIFFPKSYYGSYKEDINLFTQVEETKTKCKKVVTFGSNLTKKLGSPFDIAQSNMAAGGSKALRYAKVTQL